MRKVLRRNPGAVILDYDFGIQGIFSRFNFNFSAVRRMLHAVFHNVADSLACPCGISVKIPFGTYDKLLTAKLNGYEQRSAGLIYQHFQADRIFIELYRSGVQLRYFQQGGDKPVNAVEQPVKLVCELMSALIGQTGRRQPFYQQIYRGQRCADLV